MHFMPMSIYNDTREVQNISSEVQPTLTYSVATSNRFSVLHEEQSVQDHHDKDLPIEDPRPAAPSHCPTSNHHEEITDIVMTPYPLPQCIPSTPAHLSALVQNMRDWGSPSQLFLCRTCCTTFMKAGSSQDPGLVLTCLSQ